jgi:uroporphyrinogen decarboxylase
MKVSFWKHHPFSDQNGVKLAQEALEFHEKFKFDFLKLTPAGDWLAVCYGVKDEVWQNDVLGRRKITDFVIKNVDDFYKLDNFTFEEPILKEILKALNICSKQILEPVYATVFCPISQLIQMCGIDLFKQVSRDQPEAIFKALEVITRNTISVFEKMNDLGVKGLYFVTQHMNDVFLTKNEYDKFGTLSDFECLTSASEMFNDIIFHLHGKNCYNSIRQNIDKLSLHCEYNQEDTLCQVGLKSLGYPIIYGLPSDVLSSITSIEDCNNIISKFPSIQILTCDCVLPLNFNDESIDVWVSFAKTNL